jgi:hypothetical protein
MQTTVVRNPEGKRPVGRTRCILENNIKRDLKDIGCMGVEWINFTQDKAQWQVLVNMVMNLWFS